MWKEHIGQSGNPTVGQLINANLWFWLLELSGIADGNCVEHKWLHLKRCLGEPNL